MSIMSCDSVMTGGVQVPPSDTQLRWYLDVFDTLLAAHIGELNTEEDPHGSTCMPELFGDLRYREEFLPRVREQFRPVDYY